MLIIDCPFCGPRHENEFGYGGQAHVAYPEDPYALTDEQWAQFLFYRDNPKGNYAERWVHSAGCRKWFNAVRDTRTYEISRVYTRDDPRPDTAIPDTASPDTTSPDTTSPDLTSKVT